jgi:2-polyprenyl-3-methyl-5-hydroxy-6-metoxy-1,4-benzoquinol methylase
LAKSQFHNVLAWGQEESHLQKIQRKFLNYFPKEGRVVDLGSGRGIFLDLLGQAGFDPVGVEMDQTMYDLSTKQGHKVNFGEALDFLQKSSEKYDGIFASHVIEHMEIESGKALIEAMKSHLKPGGVMIIITPRPGSLWSSENFWLDTTHVRPYPFELMKRLVAPLEIVAGGIEPDSDPTKDYSQLAKIKLAVRKRLIGPELYDFTYGGGVSYIVAKLNG